LAQKFTSEGLAKHVIVTLNINGWLYSYSN